MWVADNGVVSRGHFLHPRLKQLNCPSLIRNRIQPSQRAHEQLCKWDDVFADRWMLMPWAARSNRLTR